MTKILATKPPRDQNTSHKVIRILMRPKTDSSRVNIYLPNKLIGIAKALATRRGISFSELMRNAMVEYLRKEVARTKSDK